MDETRVRKIVADLMEDVVVAKPKDPVAYLIETLESSAKPLTSRRALKTSMKRLENTTDSALPMR